MKKGILLLALLVTVVTSARALDTNALAVHLRKTLSLDTRTEIKVSSLVIPSGVGNLNLVTATVGGAPYPVYITKDEKQYIWGFVSDATVDPDKSRQNNISLTKVHSQGSEKAPVTVVEYSDFQCGHCKVAHDALKASLYKTYTKEQVRFVFKHFPLNGHEWAEPAAVASECAAQQKPGAFWDMADYYFTNQSDIKPENVKAKTDEIVKTLNLDKVAFDKCSSSPAVLEKVRADKKEGTQIGVNSTPAIFINGRPRRGFRDFEDVKVVIEEKLKDLKK